MAVLSGSSVKPYRGHCCMSFSFVKCGSKYFFSDADHVRERGKAIFCDLGYNKADSVLVPLNE